MMKIGRKASRSGTTRCFLLPRSSCFLVLGLLLGGCEKAVPANAPAAVADADQYADVVKKLGGRLEMRLDFSNSDITDSDLARLPLSEAVRSIDLSHTAITDAGVAELQRATRLEQLNLMDTKITEASIDHVHSMESLWQVSVEGTTLSRVAHLDLLRVLAPRVQAHIVQPKP